MTTAIRSRRNDREAAAAMRSPTEHDHDCPRPGWTVQAPILPAGRLLARCRGCTATRTVNHRTAPADPDNRKEAR